ncbi:MAG: hypothetical protein MR727_08835 [Lentisphaeria bacterium]|nr:hypothetical protein [Lentisphaeria bacterium]
MSVAVQKSQVHIGGSGFMTPVFAEVSQKRKKFPVFLKIQIQQHQRTEEKGQQIEQLRMESENRSAGFCQFPESIQPGQKPKVQHKQFEKTCIHDLLPLFSVCISINII